MVFSNCNIDRSYQTFNDKWQFKYDRTVAGDSAGYWKCDYDCRDWMNLNVPAFWDDPLVPVSEICEPVLLLDSGTYLSENQKITIPCYGSNYYLFRLKINNSNT
ncbi:MAG: hypothetical protein V1681_04370 [Candidatus Neomarinimicrobiota bacterium]